MPTWWDDEDINTSVDTHVLEWGIASERLVGLLHVNPGDPLSD
jgi:hypothetical protein